MTTLNLLVHELTTMRPDAAIVGSDHDSEWQTDDRNWFEARPMRGFRIRKGYESEPGIGGAQWVIVKQIETGKRMKVPAQWRGNGADELAELAQRSDAADDRVFHDIVLGLVWQGLVQRKFQPLSSIYAQAEALQSIATTIQ
jgi:hypothetical protein